ncbi:MAG TPA: transposase [Dissulfurispiraceae bacterium]|nr:transposase [Dissulfurispiraceae bacterium]
MGQYRSRITPRASLATVGLWMRQEGIWEEVEQRVRVPQKQVKHSTQDKLLSALVTILAGGHGVVELDKRLRPDEGLQRAFGLNGCADQSGVSRTLSACNEETVAQMQEALKMIFRHASAAYRHIYEQGAYQVLDVDMTGLPCGDQGEKATKGYFAGRRGCRGRQLGRVLATNYGESVYEHLYTGTVQLEQSLKELVCGAEEVLELDAERCRQTIVRVDGGGGTDTDINWLQERGYRVLVKVKNWQRAVKLCQTVEQWEPDPHIAGRELGWVTKPHTYHQTTRQLGMRWPKGQDAWHYSVIVSDLDDETLCHLAGCLDKQSLSSQEQMRVMMRAYDMRGGGVETSLRGSKQGLGLASRNKRSFAAQQMLTLLAQLAYNIIAWVHQQLAKATALFCPYGILRMVRDVFQINGRVRLSLNGQILCIALSQAHGLAQPFQKALRLSLASNDCVLILRKM